MDAALERVKTHLETFFDEVVSAVALARPGVRHRVGYHQTEAFPLSMYLTLGRPRSTDEDVVLMWRLQRRREAWRVTAEVLRESGSVIASHEPVDAVSAKLHEELPKIVDDCVRFFREHVAELPELIDQIPL